MSETSLKNTEKRQIPLKNKETSGTKAAPSLSNSDLLSSLGSSKAMPAGVREKMEGSFGMSLSDVKLFESPVVAENGAQAAASGKNIAFAPGKLDFTSASGQTLLGHELSHVASQARGEVTGHGYLKNSSLEHRADIEGAAAAAGETLYSAGGLRPMSTDTGLSAGPMQAKASKEERERAQDEMDEVSASMVDVKKDNKMLGQALRNALDSADVDGKVEILRQLDAKYNIREDNLSEDEKAIYESEMAKFTPEMVKSMYKQRIAYGKQYMDFKRDMRSQVAGKAKTRKDSGKIVSQDKADNDMAMMYANASDYGSHFLSYTDLLSNAMSSSPNIIGLERKYEKEMVKDTDTDYKEADKNVFEGYSTLGYTLGGMGADRDAQVNTMKNNMDTRVSNETRSWLMPKKKAWWHFW